MNYIKCQVCGNYDEPQEHNLRTKSYTPDLCLNCIEEEEQRQLKYDAFECGYDNVEEYLIAKAQHEKEVKL